MAISITPGYDFTVNEVPTRAKLQQMLDGMVIANIPAASVDGTINSIAYGWLTGHTMATLANEGDILYDLAGKMWVKTATGVCGIHNPGYGGYDTIRFKCGDPLDTAINNPAVAVDNFYGRVQSLTAANLDDDEVYYLPATTQGDNIYAMHQVTTVTGTHVRIMLTGVRRTTVLSSTGTYPRNTLTGNDQVFARPIKKSNTAVNEWKVTEFPAFNDSAVGLGPGYGICGAEEPGDQRCPSYVYGMEMMFI